MFAGEGGPERTNRRFHYVAGGHGAARLSTAFDSTTLYGEDPDPRPDIYGRIGNSGVSIATLDDMKKLYSGLRSVRTVDLGLDDDQRPRADDPRDVHEHRHRPARRAPPARDRAVGRRRSAGSPSCCRAGNAPRYKGELPPNHDGSGLALLGVTGDQLVDRATYEKIRAETLVAGTRHRAGRHPQGRPGAEHLHLLDGVRAAHDGRRAAVLHRAERPQFLLRVDLGLSHRRSRCEPGLAARVHACQRLHDRRVLPGARHEDRRVRAEPVLLLLQRHGPGIRGDRPRGAPHLGARDARPVQGRRRARRC